MNTRDGFYTDDDILLSHLTPAPAAAIFSKSIFYQSMIRPHKIKLFVTSLSTHLLHGCCSWGVNWSHSYMRYLYPRTLQHPEVCGWQLKIDNFTNATDCTEFRSPINCYLTCFFLLRTTEMILTWIGSRKTNNPNLKKVSQLLLCIKVTPRYKWPFHVDKFGAFWLYFALTKKFFFSDIIGRKDLISEGVT